MDKKRKTMDIGDENRGTAVVTVVCMRPEDARSTKEIVERELKLFMETGVYSSGPKILPDISIITGDFNARLPKPLPGRPILVVSSSNFRKNHGPDAVARLMWKILKERSERCTFSTRDISHSTVSLWKKIILNGKAAIEVESFSYYDEAPGASALRCTTRSLEQLDPDHPVVRCVLGGSDIIVTHDGQDLVRITRL